MALTAPTAAPAAASGRRLRLRRSDCSEPGIRRVRRGRGFVYLDEHGEPIGDPEARERLRALGIPPAWRDVWICPDPRGHLQATGIDAAGRKQYLYHERWREQRDRQKFERMLEFARALPALRRRVNAAIAPGASGGADGAPDTAHGHGGETLTRERVLACAARMLDLGLFRVGSEEYAEQGGGLGLTTLRREHVRVGDAQLHFDYPAKSGVRRVQTIADPDCVAIVRRLKARRGGPPELLAFRRGRRWVGIDADDVNAYLKAAIGEAFSAKDFRTWNATVVAAVALAAGERAPAGRSARKRQIAAAVREVAEMLGNTPAVARRAYIDPRVFDRFASGWTIRPILEDPASLGETSDRRRARIERAVLDLLEERPSEETVRLPGASAG
jgi:DNA topoisomerase-1